MTTVPHTMKGTIMRAFLDVAFIAFMAAGILGLIVVVSGCSTLDTAAVDRLVADVNDVGATADAIAPLLPVPLSTALSIAGGVAAGLSGAWVVVRRRIKAAQNTEKPQHQG